MREIKIYNSQSREKEVFKPIKEGEVGMYVCGPTVYNFIHVGNARCFTVFDFIRRFFEYVGYKVNYVQNFTDIDDKMIKKANEENTTIQAVAEKYIAEYYKDAEWLGITPATVHPKATEHIDGIIEIISTLIEKNHAYAVDVKDGTGNKDVYFAAKSFDGYGKLSHMNLDDLESGARVEVGEIKRDSVDFALWKAAKPNEPQWDSPWGKGRPGWHIECSVMSRKYLGETIDLHCGGVDLSFPHHENEVAQSEAATGKTLSNYWLHNGFINIDNKKMSKSEVSFMAREVGEEYGYNAVRFFVLSSHYRSPVNYTGEIMESSVASLERIYACGENLKFLIEKSEKIENLNEPIQDFTDMVGTYKERIIEALCDDFNTADAIGVLFEFIRDVNIKATENPPKAALESLYGAYNEFCTLFGFKRDKKESVLSESEILAFIEQRTQAKKDRDYKKADEIRDMLKEKGIILEDTAQGVKWKTI